MNTIKNELKQIIDLTKNYLSLERHFLKSENKSHVDLSKEKSNFKPSKSDLDVQKIEY